MARINQASLRAQLDDCRAQFDAIKQKGEASADTLALINALFMLVDIVVAVFLEKTTPKTSRKLQSAEFTGRHRRRRDPHRGQIREPRTEGTPRTLRHPAHGHHDAHQPGHRVPAVRPRPDRDRVHRTRAAHRGRHRLRDRRTSGHRQEQELSALPHPDQGQLPRHHAGSSAVRTRDRRLCRAPALCPDGPAQADCGHDPGDDRTAALRGHPARLRLAPASGPGMLGGCRHRQAP